MNIKEHTQLFNVTLNVSHIKPPQLLNMSHIDNHQTIAKIPTNGTKNNKHTYPH